MKLYELTYLISPKLTLEEAEKFSEKITSLIGEERALVEIKKPNKTKLAYPIKKTDDGYLASISFYSGSERLNELERKIVLESEILRHLILAKKVLKKIEIPKKLPRIKKLETFVSGRGRGKPKKVELEEIEKKLEEILGE